jgi:PAS domain S-box-containing protein
MARDDPASILPRIGDTGFRALVEHAADGVALLTADGIVRYASPAVTRILGYAPAELVGRMALELVPAEDRVRVDTAFADALSRPGHTVDVEHRYRAKDGSPRWIESRFTNLLDEPSVAAVVSNFRDVTERVEAETARGAIAERYSALVAAADDVIYTMDLAGTLLSVNPAVQSVAGYRPDELIGRSVALLVAPDELARSRVMLDRKLAG